MEEDDEHVSTADPCSMAASVRFVEAAQFLWHEADLLDRKAYREWLQLWTPQAKYIVPIERDAQDFENALNYVYDDRGLREKRVERLLSGYAPSENPATRTVRTVSRFRILSEEDDSIELSSALMLVAYRRQAQRVMAADVTHKLVRTACGLRIGGKIVRLIDSDEPLTAIGFIL